MNYGYLRSFYMSFQGFKDDDDYVDYVYDLYAFPLSL